MPVARTIASRARKKQVAGPRVEVHCALSSSLQSSLQIIQREERQLTGESLGRSADGYRSIPVQIDKWFASNARVLLTFHFGSRGMGGASVLLVGPEAAMKFSRHIPIMRGDSVYGNGKEYERDAVTDATVKPRDINKTVGIAHLRAL